MIPVIGDAQQQTWLVAAALAIFGMFFVTRRSGEQVFSHSLTQQLKGVAILAVVFGHVGYFLVEDHRFLVPLSNFSGIGVDLFLIMSGFGLIMSQLNRPLPWLAFYKRRFSNVYFPVAGVLILCLALDWLFLRHTYSVTLTIKNLLGFFPQADLYKDVNSPLWFITPLLVYYLLFPLFKVQRAPFLLPALFLVLGYIVTKDWFLNVLPVTDGVRSLYRVHAYGFAVGTMLGTIIFYGQNKITQLVNLVKQKLPQGKEAVRYGLLTVLFGFLAYTLVHTHIGEGWELEETTSIISSLLVIASMMLFPVEVRLLEFFGKHSFGIYLLHWPLMSRYDLLFTWLPTGTAMVAYLALFVGGGVGYSYLRFRMKKTEPVLVR